MGKLAAAVAALLMTTGLAFAQPVQAVQTQQNRATAPAPQVDEYASEQEAKSRCSGQEVVWFNKKSHVYHWAESKQYGHTKQGAFMCQQDAQKVGRAAKNERKSTTRH